MSAELTTFEENYNQWKVDHPTRSPESWVATTDRNEAARFISKQAEKIRETQLQAADDIIASQEQARKELKAELSLGIDDIVEGLDGMKSTFEWGFSELVWQIEKQREVLKGILETLQKPLDTQAKELKKRADRAYRNGLYDDALRDFLESEKKNPYDFTVHQTVGNIYFFHKKNSKKALEYYQKAVKYAEPESPYYASYALLHIAKIKYLQEKFSGAYKATKRALKLTSNFDEAHYQHSKYSVIMGKYDEAAEHLKRAISSDRGYALRAHSEKDFEEIKGRMRSIAGKIIQEDKKYVENNRKTAKELVNKAKLEKHADSSAINATHKKLDEASQLLQERSLFDCRAAVKVSNDAVENARIALINTLERELEHLQRKKRSIKTSWWSLVPSMFEAVLSYLGMFLYIIFFLGTIVFGAVAIYDFVGGRPIHGLADLTPILSLVFLVFVGVEIVRRWESRQFKKKKDIEEKIEKLNRRVRQQRNKSY